MPEAYETRIEFRTFIETMQGQSLGAIIRKSRSEIPPFAGTGCFKKPLQPRPGIGYTAEISGYAALSHRVVKVSEVVPHPSPDSYSDGEVVKPRTRHVYRA